MFLCVLMAYHLGPGVANLPNLLYSNRVTCRYIVFQWIRLSASFLLNIYQVLYEAYFRLHLTATALQLIFHSLRSITHPYSIRCCPDRTVVVHRIQRASLQHIRWSAHQLSGYLQALARRSDNRLHWIERVPDLSEKRTSQFKQPSLVSEGCARRSVRRPRRNTPQCDRTRTCSSHCSGWCKCISWCREFE